MLPDAAHLEDMRHYASEAHVILRDVTVEEFLGNRVLQHAIVRCLTVVGEAAGNVSKTTCTELFRIPWADVTGLRHVVVHDYRRVDYRRLWSIVRDDLPPLLAELDGYLARYPS